MRILLILAIWFSGLLSAQQIDLGLPQLSPRGKVTQTCGLTEISLDYGSPAVKGRKIWGKLVPFDEVWRMGANSPTTIQFSKPVIIENDTVSAGIYAMHAYPLSKDRFDIALSKNIDDWTDTTQEIIRFQSQLRSIPFTERLRFTIRDFTDNNAIIALQWESLELSFQVDLLTERQVEQRFQLLLDPNWETFAQAAQYALDVLGNYQLGKTYAKKAYSLSPNFLTAYIVGSSALKTGDQSTAKKYLNESLSLGKQSPSEFFIKEEVEQLLRKAQ